MRFYDSPIEKMGRLSDRRLAICYSTSQKELRCEEGLSFLETMLLQAMLGDAIKLAPFRVSCALQFGDEAHLMSEWLR